MENKKNHPDLVYQIESSSDVVFVNERPSSVITSQTTSLILLAISCTIAGMIQLVRYRYVSKGLQPIYNGAVVSNGCAFPCSFCALFLQNKPRLARICVYCSVAAMATVVALLLCADRSEMMKDGAAYSTD